jgi:beta-glucanase (GH16 family)
LSAGRLSGRAARRAPEIFLARVYRAPPAARPDNPFQETAGSHPGSRGAKRTTCLEIEFRAVRFVGKTGPGRPAAGARVKRRFMKTLCGLFVLAAGWVVPPVTAAETNQAWLPPAPEGKRWQLIWHDEFEGDRLDETKWNRLGDWKRRDGYWVQDDAYLNGKGSLVLRTRRDGDRFTCGAINTRGKFEHAFGYFEARCQMPKQPGHWSAFWLMAAGVNTVGNEGRDGTEIDIVEMPWRDGRLTANLHWDGYGPAHKSDGRKFTVAGVTEGFHTYGLLWLPAEYVFYVDGQEVWRSRAGGVSQVPEFIKLTDEIGTWAGDIRQAKLPDYFEVDYVRVYDAVK